MPTKKRFANCPEIAFPDSLPAKGEELPDRRGGCRDPLVRQRGPAAAGYLKSHPVKDQEVVRQWARPSLKF
jgi:hypothetical protein